MAWTSMTALQVQAPDTATPIVGGARQIVGEWLGRRLFPLGGDDVLVGELMLAILIFGLGFIVARLSRKVVRRLFRVRRVFDEGLIGTAQRLTTYAIVLTFTMMALSILGLDLSTLFAAGAIAAVAIGFALQTILQNFVAGVILLMERSITPLDVLGIDDQIVKVEDMRIRSTIARTLNEEEIIIPNSQLVSTAVKNYTLGDSLLRLRTTVGVAYSSDVDQVFEVLKEAGSVVEGRYPDKDPVVLFTDFGDSALLFEVSVWVKDPWKSRLSRSHLNHAIWRHLKDADITVAFPQLDVHFDPGAFDARGADPA